MGMNAEDDLDQFSDESDLDAITESEDMGDEEEVELEDEGDIEAEDEGDDEVIDESDMGEEEAEDDEIIEEMAGDMGDDDGEGEDLTDDSDEELDVEAEDDMGDEEMEDEGGEEIVESSDLVVTASNLHAATRRFTKRALARMINSQVVASSQQMESVKMTGILIANCGCGHATVASDEAIDISCANCGHEFERHELRAASIVAEDLAETEEDVVEVTDEAEEGEEGDEMAGDMEFDDLEAEDVEDDMAEEELAGDLDSIDVEVDAEQPAEEDLPENTIEGGMGRRCKTKAKYKTKARYKAKAGSNCKTKAEEGEGEGDDFSDEITELDLSETDVAASDALALAFVNDPAGKNNQWMLSVNNVPVATLAYNNLKGELKTIAGDNFARRPFYDTLTAALFADRSKVMTVARDVGFVGIKVPAVVDRVVASQVARKKEEVATASQRETRRFVDSFRQNAVIAGVGLNKGFWRGVNNPVRAALATAVERAGLRGGTKLVAEAFDKHGAEMVETLIARTLDLMAKSDEARKEIASAIKQMGGYVQAEDDVPAPAEETTDEGKNDDFGGLLESSAKVVENRDNGTGNGTTLASGNSFAQRLAATLRR